ncbi:MAG: helix-turn-helix transcriptional regulator [Chloroflexota bacterium]
MGLMDDSMKERFRKARGQNAPQQQEKELDVEEYYRLQAKMLGVLLRDARLNSARTEEDCARIVGVPVQEYMNWEFGDAAPTMPQIEILAFYLGVPVSHFWSSNTLRDQYSEDRRAEQEYMQLRTRMLGVLLRTAREEAQLTVEQLAEETKLPVARIQQYEMGEAAIPVHELQALARGVRKTMNYFLETSGTIGELLATREQWKHFSELSEEEREFAANPVNKGFIRIAIMFSKMPTKQLREVGSSIVDITM